MTILTLVPYASLVSDYRNSNRPRIETIPHVVSKFHFNRACFQRREASTKHIVSNNICVSYENTI